MTGVVGAFFERTGLAAAAQGRRFSGVDLARHALFRLEATRDFTGLNQIHDRLASVDVSALTTAEKQRDGRIEAIFDVDDACMRCEIALTARRFRGRVAAGVLLWLLDDDTDDALGSFSVVRRALSEGGLGADLLLKAEKKRRESMLIGTPIDQDGEVIDADDLSGRSLVGRRAALEVHSAALRRALRTGEHYLIVGGSGVGKTAFAKRLVEASLRHAAVGGDPQLESLRFLWCSKSDLLGGAETARQRCTQLLEAIEDGWTPILDNIDIMLSQRLPAGEEILRALGHEFIAGRRGFVLIAERSAAERMPFIANIPRRLLPSPPNDDAERIAFAHLRSLAVRDPEAPVLCGAPEALAALACKLARENYAEVSAPQAGLRVLDGAIELSRADAEPDQVDGVYRLDEDALQRFVARDLNTPLELVQRDGAALRTRLTEELTRRVIAQDHAVAAVAEAVAFGERLSTGQTPRARLLLAGPPGVGKTQLARSLADALGYDREAFVVMNMSEYSTEGARTRFLGADPGYKGFGDTQTIYEIVRARPSCVILLDEIDRAHPSIQDILLSILEGQGVDATGRPVYFSRAVILATTNLGMEQIETKWREATSAGISRDETVAQLNDSTLRDLILAGALDDTERAMQRRIEERIAAARSTFANATSEEEENELTNAYIALTHQRDAFEVARRHSPLDRAFLDRIDFLIPFLPIDRPEEIAAIVDLKTRQIDWTDCPSDIRASIVEAVQCGGSVRMIERLLRAAYIASIRAENPPK